MRIFNISILIGSLQLFTINGVAQEPKTIDTLSLQSAVRQAMENNHNIQVARNNAKISKNSVHIGNAGMLPSLSISSSGTYNNEDTRQKFEQPLGEQEINGAESTNLNASMDLRYTLFDGFGNTYNYEQLKVEKDLSDVQARQTIEALLLQVVNQYYKVARLKTQYQIAQESVAISQERLQRVKSARQYSNKSRVDVLNAKVDLDSDSSSMVEAKTQYKNTKRSLNVLLGQEVETEYAVQREVTVRKELAKSQLLENAQTNNAALQAADYQLQTARLQKKIANANFYPQLTLTGSYYFSQSNNDAGFLKENQTNGVSTGLQLNIPIFAGFQNKIKAENAAMRVKNRQHQLNNKKLEVNRDLQNAYATYQQNLKVLSMEQRNVENARLNLERTRESYRLGQVNGTQVREAQVNFIRAKTRRTDARYDAKLAEVELFKIAGLLLEEFNPNFR